MIRSEKNENIVLKQRELIRKLEDAGFAFERYDGNHDI